MCYNTGGVSPVTRDYVNPERAWPHLELLGEATAAAGKLLLPRLPVYPRYVLDLGNHAAAPAAGRKASRDSRLTAAEPWLSGEGGAGGVAGAVLRAADASGLLRASRWVAGRAEQHDDDGVPLPGSWRDMSDHEKQHALLPQLVQLEQQQPQEEFEQQQEEQQKQQEQQQEQLPAGRSPVPPPRRRSAKAWSVAVGPLGVMEGLPAPAMPSATLQHLLDQVLSTASDAFAWRGGSCGQVRRSCHQTSGNDVAPPAQRPTGHDWTSAEVELLLSARGADMQAVIQAADALRRMVCGDSVSYVVNRNINYTNVCGLACTFCAFSKGKAAEALRGAPYLLPLEEVERRSAEAWARGATEVCLQG